MAFTYKVTIDQSEKVFHLTVAGNAADIDYLQFLKAYNREISEINASEYVMMLDYANLIIEQHELLSALKESYYHLFMETGFNKVIFIKSNSPS